MTRLEIVGSLGPSVASPVSDFWDAAWPVVRGCSPCSPGCDHCTAAETAQKAYPHLLSGGHFSGQVELAAELLDAPRRIQRSLLWLVCPSADLFHPRVPDSFLERVCQAMEAAPHQRFALLTKRPAKARRFFARRGRVPDNAWMGVSLELQSQLWRIAEARKIRASFHWVSAEPLLGPVAAALAQYLGDPVRFVAAGPELGPRRRPCDPTWMAELSGVCQVAGIPFFTKHILDGQTFRQVPAWT